MEILPARTSLAKLLNSNPSTCKINYDYSCELYRISTYSRFPNNVPVSERSLAKAGFYYTGVEDKVKCFSCGLMLDNWKKGDNPSEKHKRLYPSCSFILNAPSLNLGSSLYSAFSPPASASSQSHSSSSEDVAYISACYTSIPQDIVTSRGVEDLTHFKSESYSSMSTEEARLRTFHSWPLAFLSASDLAKAGFYYIGPGDKVACFSCAGKLNNWEPKDNAMSEHKRHFPDCKFVKNVAGASPRINVSNVSMQTSSSRLKTFVSWPSRIPVLPKQLADAGFYYVGRNDDVKCFCCDGGLRCWESGDDPWVEHAKWFPRCEYLLRIKGQDFVRQIQERYPHLLELLSNSETQINEAQYPPIIRLGGDSSQEDDLMMNTPVVQTVLEMGFNRVLVKQTVQSKYLTAGDGYKEVADLVSDILNAQEEQTEEERDRQTEENIADELILLRKSKMSLSQRMTTTLPILDGLLLSNVITVSEYEALKQKEPRVEQGQELIDTVLRKGTTAVQAFKNVVKECDSALYKELYMEQSLKCISSEDYSDLSMEEQLRRLQEERTCKVCMDQEVSIVFIPCGHLVVCKDCAHSLRKCPICRGTIKGTVRTFLS
ncbi:baculoviral IAP repeat-containing protein 2 [Bombina bombina]|uniref:baculoviral IAP repeat-containing protein 2 n=1 Tax=Bombina bombina TaxID=8345 RepID=UPI00235A713E|nr:baculoviral IAP repeat-containing protein 2 [Bombina bombina]XP_053564556.1 baculoviral IAP repeat-containing protein 2 [Bombina bombina]XP_053564557.1 baculoviral IAP repeat-containing protein 2 [Bombina bombina]XP_053564559.1 baculoviral IAP repeat-containing protein 2 [Bombina bombina]XP_053564560.1 baculoviral IAP repeat-containing protein 2 [Bombina bombina]